jgi:DNA polymerase I-like protein with 3'-5' exonuclease and polymerase domains
MEHAVDLKVPNKVDYESGPNWGEIKWGTYGLS